MWVRLCVRVLAHVCACMGGCISVGECVYVFGCMCVGACLLVRVCVFLCVYVCVGACEC